MNSKNDDTIGNHSRGTGILNGVRDMMIFKYADIYDMMITIGGTGILYGVPAMLGAWHAQLGVNPEDH